MISFLEYVYPFYQNYLNILTTVITFFLKIAEGFYLFLKHSEYILEFLEFLLVKNFLVELDLVN